MFSYAGNYYDFPNAALMQFLRTGNKKFLRRFIPNAIHVGDVFTCHYHPRKDLWGACRYCPPRNHVAGDRGKPYLSNEYNHNKSQCVFAHYYLTGDLRTLDNAMLLANNAYANHDADSGWAARGIGHQLAALWCTYELTGEKKYLDRMKGLAYRAMAQWRRGKYSKGDPFMWGIANEGVVYYYWVSGDKKVIEDLKTGIDKRGNRAGNNANMALGNAMVYAVTGEQKYADLAWGAFRQGKADSRPKSFGLAWRNTPFALYFLMSKEAEVAAGEITLEVEKFKLDEAEVKDLAGASGGKAVLFDSEMSAAETSVSLTGGTYEITLHMQGGDDEHDAVYISVAGIEIRTYPEERDKVMAVEPFTVQVTRDGPVKVVIMAAETGVYLDKVVLKKVK